ncbi:hypothetical protein [Rufibacter tibetensis]|uniref:Uncharacterized protein n=1 Tax=Rufibacter tibetensis TaxID=512763 RepID=A0A0P0CVM8_9BACT|nr:hypothetical protein [Rufibacter tibetensis]ALJ00763.1 hypothetical protein DC20_19460 [Rufibacter tibetensis]
MHIQDILGFGKYKGLKLLDVYRGTLNIDRVLLKDYADLILNGSLRLHYEDYIDTTSFQCVDKFDVTEHEIRTLSFYEEGVDGSEVSYGSSLAEITNNVESDIAYCLSIGNQRTGAEFGGFLSLAKFSQDYAKRLPVGADPQYISWCIENIAGFFIPADEISELENMRISKFIGVDVVRKEGGLYEYSPNIEIGRYSFPDRIKELNKAKIDKFESLVVEDHSNDEDSRPSRYGYSSWDEMSFYEAYEGDSDAWELDNI